MTAQPTIKDAVSEVAKRFQHGSLRSQITDAFDDIDALRRKGVFLPTIHAELIKAGVQIELTYFRHVVYELRKKKTTTAVQKAPTNPPAVKTTASTMGRNIDPQQPHQRRSLDELFKPN